MLLKSDFRGRDNRTVGMQPDLSIRLASFISACVGAVCLSGCGTDSSSEYHEVTPTQTAPAEKTQVEEKAAESKPGETKPSEVSPGESPEKSTGEKGTPEKTEPGKTPGEGTEAKPGEKGTEAEEPVEGSTAALLKRNTKAVANPLAGGDDGPVRLLVPDKTFQKKGDALIVSYDDLDLIKVLNLKVPEPNVMELLPDWLKKLNGEKVQIRGFMYPTFQEEGLERFVFCRDTGACCFGPNPVIYYLIDVHLQEGKTTHYIQNRPFDVTGTLRIKPGIIPETGLVYELYHLEDAVVRER